MEGRKKGGLNFKKIKKVSKSKSSFSYQSSAKKGPFEEAERLLLSPLTQQILECRIGVNITLLEPWIYVKKEKILENLELHEGSSEFLPIKDEIKNYPDEKVLMGCYGHQQDIPEEFLVCTTKEAMHCILDTLRAQEEARHQRIVESIAKTCGTWKSLGSEIEINETMDQTSRNLYTLKLIWETNSSSLSRKLRFRFAEDSPDGYVEIISPRQIFNNIYRKRLSLPVQCTAFKTNIATQTVLEPVLNKITTYSALMHPRKLGKGAVEKFISNIDEKYLFDILQTNYFMDLCNEDYVFQNAHHKQLFKVPFWELSFQDVSNCRGKKVSCVSWNAMKSGIIAASYVKDAPSMIVDNDRSRSSTGNVGEDHLTLVWSYTDVIKPHLYLHSVREVTTMTFCLYDANIVVGGCDNGQIVVWDISGRLERGDVVKSRTRQEEENRSIIQNYMAWMKYPPEVHHVNPVIYSEINISHMSPITYIEWLPADQIITKNGHFERRPSESKQMQFLACSKEGGCIDIWDLGIPEEVASEAKKKRKARLSKIPLALTKFVSPLKVLAKNFKPVFRIRLLNPDTRKPLLINKLLEKIDTVKYFKPYNPETKNDIYQRTFFKLVEERDKEAIREHKYVCCTVFGEVCSIQWEGLDYNQGCRINSVVAEVGRTRVYHDGPVVVCMESPIIKDLMLTVGGRVFAIWDSSNLQEPIFWRKSEHRYTTGTWRSTQPFQVSIIRNDTYKEIWDLMEDSKHPLKIVKCKGRVTESLYNDFRRVHAKKNTFVRTNYVGEIKVFSVSRNKEDFKQEDIDIVVEYLHCLKTKKMQLLGWISTIMKKFTVTEHKSGEEGGATETAPVKNDQESIKDDTVSRKVDNRVAQQTRINNWQAKEEAYMREVLFRNKDMKIDQIIKNSVLVKEAEKARNKNSTKFAEKIMEKDKQVESCKAILFPEQKFIKKQKITVKFSKDMVKYIKQSYIENYAHIEPATLCYIRKHQYDYFYNWARIHRRLTGSLFRYSQFNVTTNLAIARASEVA